MAGNPKNAGSWAQADVLIAPLTATDPVGGAAFSADWKFIGLLDGDAGFGRERTSDVTDTFAWGAGIIESADRNYKEIHSFTCFEDNETVMALIHPGSDLTFNTDGYSGTLKVPSKEKFKVAFEVRKGGIMRRLVSKNYAQLENWPAFSDQESEASKAEIQVTVFADDEKAIWSTYKGAIPAP